MTAFLIKNISQKWGQNVLFICLSLMQNIIIWTLTKSISTININHQLITADQTSTKPQRRKQIRLTYKHKWYRCQLDLFQRSNDIKYPFCFSFILNFISLLFTLFWAIPIWAEPAQFSEVNPTGSNMAVWEERESSVSFSKHKIREYFDHTSCNKMSSLRLGALLDSTRLLVRSKLGNDWFFQHIRGFNSSR